MHFCGVAVVCAVLLLVCRDDADGDDGDDGRDHHRDGQQKLEKRMPPIPFQNVAFQRLRNAILSAIMWGDLFCDRLALFL